MGNKESKNHGLRIIKIFPESPASSTDLQIFVDFVVDIVNKPDNFILDSFFYKYIIENEGKDIEFIIFSIITQEKRTVKINLNRNWPNADFLLGFKVRQEEISPAQNNIYRIIKLNRKMEGFTPNQDFILAACEFIFNNLEEFKEKIRVFRKVELAIYNLQTEKVHIEVVQSDLDSGIGFEIANGYLHDLCWLYLCKKKQEQDNFKESVKQNYELGNQEFIKVNDDKIEDINIEIELPET